MGKKYIIELEDKPFHKEDGDCLYRVKGFKSLVLGMTGIGMLTPYTEPDLERVKKTAHDDGYSEGYQAGRGDLNQVLSDVESDVEQIRKEAYQKGYETGYEDGYNEPGKNQQNQQEAYQRGLNDAWEAARKIADMPYGDGEKIFGVGGWYIIEKRTASEVIEKLKAHEREKEEIKVWDEVINKGNFRGVVTSIDIEDEDDVMLTIFCQDGIWIKAHAQFWKKTGRTFLELAKVLEKMRNESNEQIDT